MPTHTFQTRAARPGATGTRFAVPARPAGAAAIAGGLTAIGLGVSAAVEPDIVGAGWLVLAGVASGLLAVAVLGLRTLVDGVRGAQVALTVAASALALSACALLSATVDVGTATALSGVVAVPGAVGLVVAGVAVARGGIWRGGRRFLPLLCGVWPLATMPPDGAIWELPHFLALACWGGCWQALGTAMLSAAAAPPRRPPRPAQRP